MEDETENEPTQQEQTPEPQAKTYSEEDYKKHCRRSWTLSQGS